MPAELSSGEVAGKVADDIVAQFGRIDTLVNAVGGFAGGTSVADTDDAALDKMLDLNYRSAFFMARAVLPHMRHQGGGRILAVASRQADVFAAPKNPSVIFADEAQDLNRMQLSLVRKWGERASYFDCFQ